ncbi:Predicted phospholipase, patatin/cPLA2 family [Salinibacillus kushneri]|uniref:Predicted phospholipase, patatin/cPLA2 family n=1 Tax=Salinibacillus kushneri TaxID=237682 RepID=A0A1I0JK88_9BACI|nr:patatin family protein [Salinibacillus kushneri]SEU09918.1 Predicted phospholipase, patatin/cPLA2 family [Salinibacillus kushneri]
MEHQTGLMLEGGGMRCAYTAGVLDLFMDKNIDFPFVATASAGALIGSSYIAKQRDRNYKILKELGKNPESISFKRMFQKRELFNMEYIFDKVPNEIVPLDFDAFNESKSDFIIGTTNIETGKPVYYDTFDEKNDLFTVIRASCSLPVLSPSVTFDHIELMDGGVSNPIPIQPLMDRGMKKHVVILTRNRGYTKKATKLNWLYKRLFKEKPALQKLLHDRHLLYNQTMHQLREMEMRNELFIIQPDEPLIASRIEKNHQKLEQLYMQGYLEAEKKLEDLEIFLSTTDKPPASYIEENVPS